MANIYDQHRAAFAQVDAAVIMRGADRVATIAFKYPRDGAGRLFAYVQWIGTPMVRGFAAGGGYDKRSAACADAARKLGDLSRDTFADGTPHHAPAELDAFAAFKAALAKDDGYEWDRNLEGAGFKVWRAI